MDEVSTGDAAPSKPHPGMREINAAATHDPATAAAMLTAHLANAPGAPAKSWLRLARLHVRAGDNAAAMSTLERARARFPDNGAIIAESYRRRGELAVAERRPIADRIALAAEIDALPIAGWAPADRLNLAAALIALPDRAGARRLLAEVVRSLRRPHELRAAARFVPLVFEPMESVPLLEALLAGTRAGPWEEPGREALELSLLFALGDRAAYLARFAAAAEMLPGADRANFATIARRWTMPIDALLAEPRVIGIGLPKTATSSLAAALTRLGFFHADHQSPISHRYVTADDTIFYDSVTDCAASHQFETLYFLYPNARFVVTERSSESWTASLDRHYRFQSGRGAFDPRDGDVAAIGETVRHGVAKDLVVFQTMLHAPDAATAHRRHAERVAHFFADKPPGKLLHFDVFAGDGWPELCGFLGMAPPDGAFPHANPARP